MSTELEMKQKKRVCLTHSRILFFGALCLQVHDLHGSLVRDFLRPCVHTELKKEKEEEESCVFRTLLHTLL